MDLNPHPDRFTNTKYQSIIRLVFFFLFLRAGAGSRGFGLQALQKTPNSHHFRSLPGIFLSVVASQKVVEVRKQQRLSH
jgi:hypothetical protein